MAASPATTLSATVSTGYSVPFSAVLFPTKIANWFGSDSLMMISKLAGATSPAARINWISLIKLGSITKISPADTSKTPRLFACVTMIVAIFLNPYRKLVNIQAVLPNDGVSLQYGL